MEGRCTCGTVRYRLTDRPLFTHACHCTWCQRETGGPHAINAMIETSCLEVLAGTPAETELPTASGTGQTMVSCPDCGVGLWAFFAGLGRQMAFVRVGTLADPASCPPDIHIYTSTKLPWYVLPEGVPAVPEYYRRSQYWPAESLARRAALLAR
ncbi:MAG: GFA family protein [Albidovulum sp.]